MLYIKKHRVLYIWVPIATEIYWGQSYYWVGSAFGLFSFGLLFEKKTNWFLANYNHIKYNLVPLPVNTSTTLTLELGIIHFDFLKYRYNLICIPQPQYKIFLILSTIKTEVKLLPPWFCGWISLRLIDLFQSTESVCEARISSPLSLPHPISSGFGGARVGLSASTSWSRVTRPPPSSMVRVVASGRKEDEEAGGSGACYCEPS